jgi:predicted RNase H-like nuclease
VKLAYTAMGNSWGIDGCRSGWIAAGPNGQWLHHSNLLQLLEEAKAETVFIDMPVGLSGGGIERQAEQAARKLLGRKAASVFTPPCRSAVYAEDYRQACALQEKQNSKRISIQAWNIVPRIRELDKLLREHENWAQRMYESHPELNFCLLNAGHPILESKKTAAGRACRLVCLRQYVPDAVLYIEMGQRQFKGQGVQADDLIDALCLHVVSGLQHAWLEPGIEQDEFGLGMGFRVPVVV